MELTTHIRRFALGYDVQVGIGLMQTACKVGNAQVNKLIESMSTSERQSVESDLALLIMTRAGRRRRQSHDEGPPSKESKPRRTEVWLHPSGVDAEALVGIEKRKQH